MTRSTIDTHTEITDNAKTVVPTRGAIVKTRLEAESGRRVQFELSTDEGGKVPFGAQAYDAKGKLLGMADNQSRLLVFGVEDEGCIDVCWGIAARSTTGCSRRTRRCPRSGCRSLAASRLAQGDKLRRAAICFPDEAGRTAARPRSQHTLESRKTRNQPWTRKNEIHRFFDFGSLVKFCPCEMHGHKKR
ncbi:FimD/PapC C-terminal domain-containing protein [Burkholderia sp. YIM B11467]